MQNYTPWPLTIKVENGNELWADWPGVYDRFRLWPGSENVAVFRNAFSNKFEFFDTTEDHFQQGEFMDAIRGQFLSFKRVADADAED